MNIPRFSFVVPTRNRPTDIRSLLGNLSGQSIRPGQIVIIDSSVDLQPELIADFPRLNISYHAFDGEPSAAAQRNAGLAYVMPDAELIGFVDDDIVFEPDALEKMLAFWQTVPDDVCGAAFNLAEQEGFSRAGLKKSRLAGKLGLYHAETGAVAPSGWHTRLGNVKENTQVGWLISGAVLWRREVLERHRFDPFFQGYSYLEDLDFSYAVSRECKLMIVADAVFHHHHHHQELTADWYDCFGRMEVRNRLYFVRKHGLSVWRCYAGLCIRLGNTLLEALFQRKPVLLLRARGNLAGLWNSLLGAGKR
ncbi:glycosyltransferase family 2 protein [Thiolapillus sp.]